MPVNPVPRQHLSDVTFLLVFFCGQAGMVGLADFLTGAGGKRFVGSSFEEAFIYLFIFLNSGSFRSLVSFSPGLEGLLS